MPAVRLRHDEMGTILVLGCSSTVGCRPVIGVLLCHNNSEAKKEKTKERKDSQN